jgi:hypothetical protein
MVLKVKVSPELVAGDVDEVRKDIDVFRRNMTSGLESGRLRRLPRWPQGCRSVGWVS